MIKPKISKRDKIWVVVWSQGKGKAPGVVYCSSTKQAEYWAKNPPSWVTGVEREPVAEAVVASKA